MSHPEDAFDALLSWLDPDREIAGRKHETIRAGLIRMFTARGHNNPEHLTDIVMTRVCNRVPDISDSYVGNPARYFYGVARKVHLENIEPPKEIPLDTIDVVSIQPPEPSDELECLNRCLQFLTSEKRELILDYFLYQGHDKIEHHRTMAAELCISEGALRGRAYQIKAKLEKCVLECVQDLNRKQKPPSRT